MWLAHPRGLWHRLQSQLRVFAPEVRHAAHFKRYRFWRDVIL